MTKNVTTVTPATTINEAMKMAATRALAALAREGKTVIVVTHERELGRFFTRTISLRDGTIRADTRASHAPALARVPA